MSTQKRRIISKHQNTLLYTQEIFLSKKIYNWMIVMDPIIFQFIISFIVKACITITFLIEFSRHKKKTIGLLVFIKIIEILSYVFRIYDVLLGYYSFQWIYALIYMFWIEKTFNIGRKSIGKWIALVIVLLIIPQIALIIQMNNLLVADRQLQSNWVVFLFGIQIIIYG